MSTSTNRNNTIKKNNYASRPIDSSVNPITIRAFGSSPIPYVIIGILLAIAAAVAVNFTSSLPPLLIIGAGVAAILVISIFQRPELGGYILIFSVFTNLSDLFTEKGLPSINKPLVAIVVLSIFANQILNTGKIKPLPKFTRIDFVLMLYLLSILASAFVATNQSKALTAIFNLVKDIAVGYCIYITLDTREKVKIGLYTLLVALTFVSILGVIRTVTGTSNDFWGFAQLSQFGQVSDTDGQLRYGGAIGESNIWGQVLVSATPIILYLIAKAHNFRDRILPAISGLFIILAMLFTESRGAFIALVLVLVLVAVDMRIKSTTFLALVTILLIILFSLPAKYADRIKSLNIFFQNNGLTQDESITGRQAKMLTGLAMFSKNPFLGVGFANYTDNYWIYAGSLGLDSGALNVGTSSDYESQQPHSLYVEVAAETGIFGLSSFMAFLGLIFIGLNQARQAMKLARKIIDRDWLMLTSAIMMSILTFLIAGFFLHGIGFRFIWVLIGISLAFIRLSPNQTSPSFVRS
jgi:O-antigen ligase